jgi:hypothetical protein
LITRVSFSTSTVARVHQLRQVGECAVHQRAARAVQVQQAARAALFGRVLGDELAGRS